MTSCVACGWIPNTPPQSTAGGVRPNVEAWPGFAGPVGVHTSNGPVSGRVAGRSWPAEARRAAECPARLVPVLAAWRSKAVMV